jgi:hypothetical protein
MPGIEPGTSGSVARTTEAVDQFILQNIKLKSIKMHIKLYQINKCQFLRFLWEVVAFNVKLSKIFNGRNFTLTSQ